MYRPTLLIYGATGHSGRLIVAEATAQGIFDIIVAGRNAAGLAELAQTYPQVASRVLALQNDVELIQALEHVDIVLNAAGPFNRTALPLLRGCLQAGCDYLDICGEIDVYESLYKCWAATGSADISVVCGVGYTGAAADVLAAAALADLRQSGAAGHDRRLSSMRVCYSELSALTAGSIATALRMLTRYVTVSDAHLQAPHGPSNWTSTLVRHPVGRLERYFEFLPSQASLGASERLPHLGGASALRPASWTRQCFGRLPRPPASPSVGSRPTSKCPAGSAWVIRPARSPAGSDRAVGRLQPYRLQHARHCHSHRTPSFLRSIPSSTRPSFDGS